MQLSDFDFDLPEALIATRPARPRTSARLLLAEGDAIRDLHVSDLVDVFRPGDLLVLNNTRVIPARLFGRRTRGDAVAKVEVTLLEPAAAGGWRALAKPLRKLKPGEVIRFGDALSATVTQVSDTELVLQFDAEGAALDAALDQVGAMPLPPYIAAKRGEDEQDRADYQTVYADEEGSVAAPTAGLHFTPELLARLTAMGVTLHFVTLHVGAGTFLPVKTENLADHRMHAEYGEVDAQTADALNAAKAAGGRIVCVGTTSLRLVESATGEDGVVRPFAQETAIFITPGYRFRAADGLMTNFHLPKSTLFMLVSAFAGYETMRGAYAHAIEDGYRFYSYGDASLLWRA